MRTNRFQNLLPKSFDLGLSLFLYASTHLYNRVCPSIHPSVHPIFHYLPFFIREKPTTAFPNRPYWSQGIPIALNRKTEN